MLRSAFARVSHVTRASILQTSYRVPAATVSRGMSKHSTETDAELDARYEAYFSRADIDSWEIRKAMNDLCGMDLVPEPKIIIAALKACRRLNDFALAVRFLEAVKEKCGAKQKEIYPYILQVMYEWEPGEKSTIQTEPIPGHAFAIVMSDNGEITEIGSTVKELGISTPEELGYDKPELALAGVFD